LLRQLLEDIGPGAVQGSPTELNILECSCAIRRVTDAPYIVADGLERFSTDVLLSSRRCSCGYNRPFVYILALAQRRARRNLLLVEGGAARAPCTNGSPASSTRRAPIPARLRGAGCDWAEELIPDDVIVDIQAFTQGIVGDVNALACVLDATQLGTRASTALKLRRSEGSGDRAQPPL
jgi:hypothetical protein